ncbi:MAG: hypothetical protein NT031_02860 [Planctomycetota bacterium]|nr:hypothetical protein [Planctomycetota bacterium]
MTHAMPRRSATMGAGLALLTLAAALGGCERPQKMRVTSLPDRDVAALRADDIVLVMRRAGFSDQEVVELGADIRNTLATSGGAMVQIGARVEAMFSVDGKFLHVTTRTKGSFIYDLVKKAFL